jgi:hypothetical protein
MIIYRDQRIQADPRRLLSTLRTTANRFTGASSPSHDVTVEALIAAGTLEAAVADSIFTDSDGINPVTMSLRRASIAMGHVFWHSWQERSHDAQVWWTRLAGILNRLDLHSLPATVVTTVPEGYAHYAVYPEMYLEAAKQCRAALGNIHAICLGIRSIGTSLSAVVAAALAELGCRVESFTLRPRGHPFSRRPVLRRELEAVFQARPRAHFLVIDEGPGISGSSLAGTAAMLRALGIADDHIILFPSWQTDGSGLRSAMAREHWFRHRQFSVTFEDLWLRSGRLSREVTGRLRDFSAGAWRHQLFDRPGRYPAVQPQHERRKYLLQPFEPSASGEPKLLSFVGLGEYPKEKIRRAERLAAAGFGPKPEGVVHGFMVRPFVRGSPVSAGQSDPDFLDSVAAYLAHLYREESTDPTVSDSNLREMTRVNLVEGLGEHWLPSLEARLPREGWLERPAALDGRMLPHEWIWNDAGYVKTDIIDHHDDHFFPGCQDIAWDVAAACLELGLGAGARRYLVQRYRSLSRDRTIAARLPHHALSYLAFRLGYASLASSVLGEAADGDRFAAAARRYARLLRRELTQEPGECWCV